MVNKKEIKSTEELEALQKALQKIGEKADAGLKKLEAIMPKNVVDPERWLKVHRPDLLKDEEVASTITVWMVYAKKKALRKWLRRRTDVDYDIEFSAEEMTALEFLLENYIIEYETNPYFINMAKAILKDYRDYYTMKMRLSNRHLSMIFKSLINFLQDGMTDEYVAEQEKLMVLKFLNVFLEKSIIKKTSTLTPILNDDGTVGESKFETTQSIITIKDFIRGELKKAVEAKQNRGEAVGGKSDVGGFC